MELKELFPEFQVSVETTRRCSLKCPYCYVVARRLPRAREIGLKEIGDFIERLTPALEGRKVGVHLTGGELFTRPDALALVKRLLSLPLLLSLGTNGVSLPRELFELPPERLELQFSIDGTLPIHSLTRERGERAYANLGKALERGFRPTIRTTVHRGNLGSMADFYRSLNALASSYGVKLHCEVQPVILHPELRPRHIEPFRLRLEEYLSVGLGVITNVEGELPHVRSSWRFVSEIGEEKVSLVSALFGCGTGAGFDIIVDGDVVACEMDSPIGNLREMRSSSEVASFLSRLERRQAPARRCFKCPLAPHCGMCRLAPLMHGYPAAFGFRDCEPFMKEVVGCLEELTERDPKLLGSRPGKVVYG